MARNRAAKVPQIIHDMPDNYLLCRTWNHNWIVRSAFKARYQRAAVYEATVVCQNCKMERTDVINLSGHIVSRSYRHPRGYLVTGAGKALSKDNFRVETMMRLHPIERPANE